MGYEIAEVVSDKVSAATDTKEPLLEPLYGIQKQLAGLREDIQVLTKTIASRPSEFSEDFWFNLFTALSVKAMLQGKNMKSGTIKIVMDNAKEVLNYIKGRVR